ncbi:MAG: hypothetical protein J6334_10240, partial [Kiritimatiellae bacterium]|nr:hypothetical protein [Kiritimatiellia bacterium]
MDNPSVNESQPKTSLKNRIILPFFGKKCKPFPPLPKPGPHHTSFVINRRARRARRILHSSFIILHSSFGGVRRRVIRHSSLGGLGRRVIP